jgi:hypothetical protein
MSLRGLNWVVLAGFAGCIPAPVLRPRDGGADVAAEDRAAVDAVGIDAPQAMDAGADGGLDAGSDGGSVDAVIPPMDVVDAGGAPVDAVDVPGAVDAVDVVDACPGVLNDAGACVEATRPRLLSPLSGAISGSHRPLVRWVHANTGRPQTLRFCADRACTRVLLTRMLAADLSAEVLDADLPRGPVFWRVETTDARGEALTSATWEFFVSGRSIRSVFWYGVPDFDGDGVADLVVGAPGNASDLGRAYGYRGQSIGSGTPSWTLRGGEEPEGYFGYWVQSVGDVNGDGFVDLGVTGVQENARRGTVRVFLGSSSGLSATSNTVLAGASAGESFGLPVAGVGDVNQDGFADMAIGITGAVSGTGAMRLYFGGAGGVSTERSILVAGPGPADTQFGGSILGAGDLDQDGIDDVVVGAPAVNSNGGSAWVMRGSRTLALPVNLFAIPRSLVGRFGEAISTAGDLDGNGRVEFVVSAPHAEARSGRVQVYTAGDSATPVNPLDIIVPTGSLASLFGSSIAGGNDLNGDEYPDLMIGAPRERSDQSGTVGFAMGGTGRLMLSTVLRSRSPEARGSFGFVSSMPGDTDGDGLADVAVSSPDDPMLRPAVYLYRGNATGVVGVGASAIENPEPRPVIWGTSVAR